MSLLEVQLERYRYKPGEVIRGRVLVNGNEKSRSLEAFLIYKEETVSYTGSVHSVGSGPLVQDGKLERGQQFEFTLRVPDDVLPAFRTQHGALWWEVDVKNDRRGFDDHATVRVDVELPDPGGVVFPAAACFLYTGLGGKKPPPPPNWYPDPQGRARFRWWDGLRWTEHTG